LTRKKEANIADDKPIGPIRKKKASKKEEHASSSGMSSETRRLCEGLYINTEKT